MRIESLWIFAQQAGPQLTAQSALLVVLLIFGALAALVCISLLWNFGSLWIQAMMSGADVSMPSLIGMYFRQVRSSVIVNAKVMAAQAEADVRMARAQAEQRRSEAIAQEQVMKAEVARNRANLVLAEAEVPKAMASAFRSGHFQSQE